MHQPSFRAGRRENLLHRRHRIRLAFHQPSAYQCHGGPISRSGRVHYVRQEQNIQSMQSCLLAHVFVRRGSMCAQQKEVIPGKPSVFKKSRAVDPDGGLGQKSYGDMILMRRGSHEIFVNPSSFTTTNSVHPAHNMRTKPTEKGLLTEHPRNQVPLLELASLTHG